MKEIVLIVKIWYNKESVVAKESNMALNFTLLTAEQIWGDKNRNGQLDVMKKYGTRVAPTDLAILLGGNVTECNECTSEYDFTGISWTAFSNPRDGVHCIDYGGDDSWVNTFSRMVSTRPVLPPSETEKLTPANRKRGVNGVEIVEYGEYPQALVKPDLYGVLETEFKNKTLQKTGKMYTFDDLDPAVGEVEFRPNTHPEYEYQGKKYIRCVPRLCRSPMLISHGKKLNNAGYYWVEVQPIEWLVEPTGTWVSKKALFAGIHFDPKREYDGNFSKTFMKKYLDTYFSKEIEPSELIAQKREKAIKGLSEKLAEISDLEKVKAAVTPARTPERTETLARIMRVRKAKTLLSKAAQKAHKEGDQKTLQEIVEMAKPYAAREAVVLDKFHQRRAERRAKKERD